ncbi:MAG: hypothetical protein P8Y42_21895 [Exilibacterium sp.]
MKVAGGSARANLARILGLLVLMNLYAIVMEPLGFLIATERNLGDMIERNFRRAMMISDGSLNFLWERPLTLCIFLVSVTLLAVPLADFLRSRKTPPQSGAI